MHELITDFSTDDPGFIVNPHVAESLEWRMLARHGLCRVALEIMMTSLPAERTDDTITNLRDGIDEGAVDDLFMLGGTEAPGMELPDYRHAHGIDLLQRAAGTGQFKAVLILKLLPFFDRSAEPDYSAVPWILWNAASLGIDTAAVALIYMCSKGTVFGPAEEVHRLTRQIIEKMPDLTGVMRSALETFENRPGAMTC